MPALPGLFQLSDAILDYVPIFFAQLLEFHSDTQIRMDIANTAIEAKILPARKTEGKLAILVLLKAARRLYKSALYAQIDQPRGDDSVVMGDLHVSQERRSG